MTQSALELAKLGRQEAEALLAEAIGFESISSSRQHRNQMRDYAAWLSEKLAALGFSSAVIDVMGGDHPILRADLLVSPDAPTLTIYGHYDVQPADPVEGWTTPPFEAHIRDGKMYGRGACDNKGNHIAFLLALKYLIASGGNGINVRVLMDGEEEITGHTLATYLAANAPGLRTDYVLVWDGGFEEPGQPQITVGLRGELYTEIHVAGACRDLHSGYFGGVAPNPILSLTHILSALKDKDGLVRIPGFYDGVDPRCDTEFLDEGNGSTAYGEALRAAIGVKALEGELDYPAFLRRTLRPTLDAHGILGGFTGEGEKTVIPASAFAKVSMRLVHGQDPGRIFEAMRDFVACSATPGVDVELRLLGKCRPFRCATGHTAFQLLSDAFAEGFGRPAEAAVKGSTIPITVDLQSHLGGQIVVSGLAQPEPNIHSPDEHIDLDYFHRGIDTLIRFVASLAQQRS